MRDLNRYEKDYEALPFEAVQVRFRRRKLLEIIARLSPRRILEVGCGLEPLFLHLSNFDAMHVAEPTARFHANAVRLATGKQKITVHFETLQKIAPKLSGEHFDFIAMCSLLHEVSDPEELLAAARALCRPNTILHVSVPNAESLHRRLAVAMGLIGDVHEISETQKKMQQATTYDTNTLQVQLRAAGFETIESGSYFIKPFTHVQMQQLREQGVLTEPMLDGLYALSKDLPNLGSEIYANVKRAA